MTFNLSEQQEKKYLQQVIGIINDTIQNTDTSVKEHVETLQEYKDYICQTKISIRMKSDPCAKASSIISHWVKA